MKQKQSRHQCLLHAILSYDAGLNEEQGGFILKRPDEEHYQFVKVTNKNTGSKIALALYTAEPVEFNDEVLMPTLEAGWDIYASFHTHPNGMRALPSHIDVTKLFTSFPINYIYAPEKELNRFDYSPEGWRCTNIMAFNGFNFNKYSARIGWLELENI